MKLWNVLSVAALGTLFAVGCSSTTTTTTDGGTTSDTGAKTDTGTATDTGTKTDGAVEDCPTCQKNQCATEQAACSADATKLKGCNDLITCINACSDATCANACVSASTSTEGKDLVTCIFDKCATACGG